MTSFSEWLDQHNACNASIEFAQGKTPREAWETCQRPDWLLWALEQLGYNDQRVLRLFACRCVRQVWHLLPDGPLREVVQVAERHADGMATAEELAAALVAARAAAWAAGDAARGAAKTAARDAAWEASQAARAVAKDAAMDAPWDAAWCAARATAADAAGDLAWPSQADILRELIPWDVVAEFAEFAKS